MTYQNKAHDKSDSLSMSIVTYIQFASYTRPSNIHCVDVDLDLDLHGGVGGTNTQIHTFCHVLFT